MSSFLWSTCYRTGRDDLRHRLWTIVHMSGTVALVQYLDNNNNSSGVPDGWMDSRAVITGDRHNALRDWMDAVRNPLTAGQGDDTTDSDTSRDSETGSDSSGGKYMKLTKSQHLGRSTQRYSPLRAGPYRMDGSSQAQRERGGDQRVNESQTPILECRKIIGQDTISFIHQDGRTSTYTLDGVLGKGSFGTVYAAKGSMDASVPHLTDVAIKFATDGSDGCYALHALLFHQKECVIRSRRHGLDTEILREIVALHALRDVEQVVKMTDWAVTDDVVRSFIVLERAVSSLLDLQRRRNFSPVTTNGRSLMHDILLGMQAVNKIMVWHRDLKPANILIFGQEGTYRAKIADFGLARVGPFGVHERRSVVGTSAYQAPEVIAALLTASKGPHPAILPTTYGQEAEVYSVGMVLLGMLVGTETACRVLAARNPVCQLLKVVQVFGVNAFHNGSPDDNGSPGTLAEALEVEYEQTSDRRACFGRRDVQKILSDHGEQKVSLLGPLMPDNDRQHSTALVEGLLFPDPARRFTYAEALTSAWFTHCHPDGSAPPLNMHQTVVDQIYTFTELMVDDRRRPPSSVDPSMQSSADLLPSIHDITEHIMVGDRTGPFSEDPAVRSTADLPSSIGDIAENILFNDMHVHDWPTDDYTTGLILLGDMHCLLGTVSPSLFVAAHLYRQCLQDRYTLNKDLHTGGLGLLPVLAACMLLASSIMDYHPVKVDDLKLLCSCTGQDIQSLAHLVFEFVEGGVCTHTSMTYAHSMDHGPYAGVEWPNKKLEAILWVVETTELAFTQSPVDLAQIALGIYSDTTPEKDLPYQQIVQNTITRHSNSAVVKMASLRQ
jgi:serine/threonine protein kinase